MFVCRVLTWLCVLLAVGCYGFVRRQNELSVSGLEDYINAGSLDSDTGIIKIILENMIQNSESPEDMTHVQSADRFMQQLCQETDSKSAVCQMFREEVDPVYGFRGDNPLVKDTHTLNINDVHLPTVFSRLSVPKEKRKKLNFLEHCRMEPMSPLCDGIVPKEKRKKLNFLEHCRIEPMSPLCDGIVPKEKRKKLKFLEHCRIEPMSPLCDGIRRKSQGKRGENILEKCTHVIFSPMCARLLRP